MRQRERLECYSAIRHCCHGHQHRYNFHYYYYYFAFATVTACHLTFNRTGWFQLKEIQEIGDILDHTLCVSLNVFCLFVCFSPPYFPVSLFPICTRYRDVRGVQHTVRRHPSFRSYSPSLAPNLHSNCHFFLPPFLPLTPSLPPSLFLPSFLTSLPDAFT